MRTPQENDLQPREQPEQPSERLDAGTEFGDAWGTVHVPGVGVPWQCQVTSIPARASSSQMRSPVGSWFSAQQEPGAFQVWIGNSRARVAQDAQHLSVEALCTGATRGTQPSPWLASSSTSRLMGSTCGAYIWFRWSARNAGSCMRRLTGRSCPGGPGVAVPGPGQWNVMAVTGCSSMPLPAAPVWPCGGSNNANPLSVTVRRT